MPKKAAQVEPDKDDAPQNPRLAKRAEVMESVSRARKEQLRSEGVIFDEEEPERDDDAAAQAAGDAPAGDEEAGAPPPEDDREEPEPGEAEGEEEPPEVAEPGGEPEKHIFDGDPTKTFIKTTVDGEEKLVPLSEAVASSQVVDTANKRMELANRLIEDSMKLQDRLTRGGGDGPRPSDDGAGGAADQGQPSAKARSLDDVDWEKLGKDLQYADPNEAGRAMRSLVEQIQSMGADPSATREELIADAMNRMEWAQSQERSRSEHSDIWEDPYTATLFGNVADQMWRGIEQRVQQGERRPPYFAVWDAAAKEVRNWLEKRSGGNKDLNKNPNASPGQTPEVDVSDKSDRKRAAAPPPEPRRPQPRRSPQASQPPANPEQAINASRQKSIQAIQESRRGQANRG